MSAAETDDIALVPLRLRTAPALCQSRTSILYPRSNRNSYCPETEDLRPTFSSESDEDCVLPRNVNSTTVFAHDFDRVDYVLVYKDEDDSPEKRRRRECFESRLREEGVLCRRSRLRNHVFIELYCLFDRLCIEAECMGIRMELKANIKVTAVPSKISQLFKKRDQAEHLPTYRFLNEYRHLYVGVQNQLLFFRPALRSLLVNHILECLGGDSVDLDTCDGPKSDLALSSLLRDNIISDAFILHDHDNLEEGTAEPSWITVEKLSTPWLSALKGQPLHDIRNYFGEKLALFFAWHGMLLTSLWLPALSGLGIVVWGSLKGPRFQMLKNSTNISFFEGIEIWAKDAFDNKVTPLYAFAMCIWGTLFLEFWKRKNAKLIYQWGVYDHEPEEEIRPQYVLTEEQGTSMDQCSRWTRLCTTFVFVLFMMLLVLAVVVGVIFYRVISRVEWFPKSSSWLLSGVTSSLLDAICILVLGKLYNRLARILTNWENNRLQVDYEYSLARKMFCFHFVNTYSALFYIAFFRQRTSGGVFGQGTQYSDVCGRENDCMPLLSLQLAAQVILNCCQKLLVRTVLPGMKLLAQCVRRSLFNQSFDNVGLSESKIHNDFSKLKIDDVCLEEFSEKVIMYGYLMMFAAALPIAPLLILMLGLLDLRTNASRLLYFYRRPIAEQAVNIGIWYAILEFVNLVGVLTNAFIVGVTSTYGRSLLFSSVNISSTCEQQALSSTESSSVEFLKLSSESLWVVVIFQNLVLTIKFFVAYAIADVPSKIRVQQRLEKRRVIAIFRGAGYRTLCY